jgi:hypothetical protein
MGLLDDAIREHLELKRRRGADPGEVAREQREALEPVFPGQRSGADGDAQAGPDAEQPDSADAAGAAAPAAEEPLVGSTPEPSADDAPAAVDSSAVGQETVELDMESVLDDEHEEPEPPLPGQDSLEWEVPDRAGVQRASEEPHAGEGQMGERAQHPESHEYDEQLSDVPGDVPGQERLSFE